MATRNEWKVNMNDLNANNIIAERYQIIKTLGHGGTSITYAAKDLQLEKPVALKVLYLHRMHDWKVLELFEREAKTLANLNYPGIPQYLDYFQVENEQEKIFYLVQQLAMGRSLFDWINQGWRPSIEEVQIIAAEVLKILIYLQQLTPAVIHRDIKPQNIIRSSEGKIFLVDFGAVQDIYNNTLTGGSTIVGTFGYMAPEQYRGQAVLSTDLYGLGTTLLFLLTGKSPTDLPQRQLKINFKSEIQLPKHFAHWLERMIEPVITTRFTSAQQALEVLLGKSLPPLPTVCKRPKNTQIQVIKEFNKLTIDIPSTLLNSPQSFWLGLAPLFVSIVSLVITYGWITEFVEPTFGETPLYLMFSFFILINMIMFTWLIAAKTLIFSSTFSTRVEITHWYEIQTKKILLNFWSVKQEIPASKHMPKVYLEQYRFLFWKFSGFYCTFKSGLKKAKFGLFLSRDEKAWLVREIHAYLEACDSNKLA
jgi:eukaryotic-like serine/threonine-protein kinase